MKISVVKGGDPDFFGTSRSGTVRIVSAHQNIYTSTVCTLMFLTLIIVMGCGEIKIEKGIKEKIETTIGADEKLFANKVAEEGWYFVMQMNIDDEVITETYEGAPLLYSNAVYFKNRRAPDKYLVYNVVWIYDEDLSRWIKLREIISHEDIKSGKLARVSKKALWL